VSLHALGKTYGQRPSAWVSGLDEIAAYQFDLAVLRAGVAEERSQTDRARAMADAKARVSRAH
jgi:hypothetical protein